MLTSAASKGPSRDWLKIVRSGEARNKIRQYFKREMRQENIQVGKTEIDRELRRFGRNYTEAQKEEIVHNVAARMSLEVEDFYNNIGYGGLSVSKLTSKLRDEFTRVVKPNEAAPKQPREGRPPRPKGRGPLAVGHSGRTGGLRRQVRQSAATRCRATRSSALSPRASACPSISTTVPTPSPACASPRTRTAGSSPPGRRSPTASITAISRPCCISTPSIRPKSSPTSPSAFADLKVALNSVTTRENGDSMLLIVGLKCSSIEHLKNIIGSLKKAARRPRRDAGRTMSRRPARESARCTVNGAVTGEIGVGLLVFVGVGVEDTERDVAKCAEKLAGLRIFEDDAGKMSRSAADVGGGLLVISQFHPLRLGPARPPSRIP